MRKFNIDKDFLEKRYCVEKKTLRDIALELGVSRQTISNKLQEYGIEIRNSTYIKVNKKPKKKLKKICRWRNKNDFQKVYSELKSLELVAKHYGINITTACDWKQKHGIETIKEYSVSGKRKLNRDKPYMNKQWLEDMYSKYSWEELGKMLNCNPTTLSKWGAKFGIKTRTVSEQWKLKAKNGNTIIKDLGFDLQLYKNTYVLGHAYSLPKKLKNFIISLYDKCESCGYNEVLDLHHIDENHHNNAPENHGVLCPNCHAKIHRLGISFNQLVPNHISWETLLNSYQEAK